MDPYLPVKKERTYYQRKISVECGPFAQPNSFPHLERRRRFNARKLTVQVKQNEKVCLSYNPRLFCCEVEKITLQDPRLSNIWGERLYRISLKAINKELNGHYVYKIFKIK